MFLGMIFPGKRSHATIVAHTARLGTPVGSREGRTDRATGSLHPLGACSDRHGCRRAGLDTRGALHLDVPARDAVGVAVALGRLGDKLLVLLAAAAIGRDGARGSDPLLRGDLNGLGLWWCGPSRDLPLDAGEGLEMEPALGPLPTRLAGAIESAQASVDSTLVRLGAESVCSSSRLERAVIPRAVLVCAVPVCWWRLDSILTFVVSSWALAFRGSWPMNLHSRQQQTS